MASSTQLFINGDIHTMESASATVSALLVEGGRVSEVATSPEAAKGLAARNPDAQRIDLRGRTVVPGFIDAHNHLSISALYPRWANFSAVSNEDELYQLLTEQDAAEPDTPWIRGANWNTMTAAFPIDRDLLDGFGFSRPIMVADMSLHEGIVDSRGLDLLQVSAATADPRSGVIHRDGRGRPTGHLVERAWSKAHALSMSGYDEPDRWGESITERAHVMLQEGITAIHDAACSPRAEDVYQALARAGDLPISVLSMPHPAAMQDADELGSRLAGPVTGEGDEWFRIGPVKLFADGGKHAAVSCAGNPATQRSGIYFDDIETWIPRIADRGFRVAVHAVGDFAIRGCLNAFHKVTEQDSGSDHRFRIEHAIHPVPGQIEAMKALGVVACVQPGLVGDYGDGVIARAGADSGDEWFPFRSMLDEGVPLAASSDDPCAPLGPIVNSIPAATRRTTSGLTFGASQKMPLRDWIFAYTAGAAYAGGQEDERGMLSVGRRADLVVMEGTLDEENPPSVAETWVGGTLVWSASGARQGGE